MMTSSATRLDPVSLAWNTIASYDSYPQAQAAVDRLSDEGFPVQYLDILGSDLRLVERVTGRLTTTRAALAGGLSGAWLGLFVGLLLGLFTSGHAWVWLLAAGVLCGGLAGAGLGFAAHSLTRGQRDFASTRSLIAQKYDLIARGGNAERAKVILGAAGLLPAATPLAAGAHLHVPERDRR
jgi:hypothetical protein